MLATRSLIFLALAIGGMSRHAAAAAALDAPIDCTRALQAAINVAAPDAGGSGVVILPAGTCMLGTALRVPAGVTLRAAARGTMLKATAGNTASPLLLSIRSPRVRVEGVVFDGNAASNIAHRSPAIIVYETDHVVFDRITVQNTNGLGVEFSGGSTGISDSGVRRSRFRHVGIRWKATGRRADQHQGVAFSNGQLAQNRGNFVSDSQFDDVGLDSISASNQMTLTITGNSCRDVGGDYRDRRLATGACIYLSLGELNTDVTISHNTSDHAAGNGIEANGHQVVAVANRVTGSGAAGLQFSGTDLLGEANVLLNNNQSEGLAWSSREAAGIVLAGKVHNLRLVGNTATDTQPQKTQRHGLQRLSNAVVSNLVVSADNRFVGNRISSMSGIRTDTVR